MIECKLGGSSHSQMRNAVVASVVICARFWVRVVSLVVAGTLKLSFEKWIK